MRTGNTSGGQRYSRVQGGVAPLRAIKSNGPDATVVLVEMWTLLDANSLGRSGDL